MIIGKIVRSDSHISYMCQIYGTREVEQIPSPADYAFGTFVCAAVRHPRCPGSESDSCSRDDKHVMYVVGVIYDTLLLNPSFGALGPRLSTQEQSELFSPDYIGEQAVVTSILLLGTWIRQQGKQEKREQNIVTHGIPPLSLDLGSEIETMTEEEVRRFHFFSDAGKTTSLHLGYLPHLIAQRNGLLPLVALQLLYQLEWLFPDQASILSIIKHNFDWRLKVEPTG